MACTANGRLAGQLPRRLQYYILPCSNSVVTRFNNAALDQDLCNLLRDVQDNNELRGRVAGASGRLLAVNI